MTPVNTRNAATSRTTTPAAVRVGETRETLQPFATFGEQLGAIRRFAEMGTVDPRLLRSAGPSGMSEGLPSEGGFAVQPDFADEILGRAYQTGQILRHVRRYDLSPTANGAIILAFDETSRADGNRLGGVVSYWLNEGDTVPPSKPKLRRLEPNLQKLVSLYYLTEELEADAPSFSPTLLEAFSNEIAFTLEDAIVTSGTSSSVRGLLKSPALIPITKEAAQAAATFNAQNAVKMFSRLFCSATPDGVVWLVNQDTFPQILSMNLASGTAVQQLYVAAVAGDVDAPYGRLIGRPVLPCESCSTLGTPGDVILVDLSQYLVADRVAKQARSIHVEFLRRQTAFRIVYRVAGQPIWHKVTTPKNGTNTVSSHIVLEAR